VRKFGLAAQKLPTQSQLMRAVINS
jgi:hypothetical protein